MIAGRVRFRRWSRPVRPGRVFLGPPTTHKRLATKVRRWKGPSDEGAEEHGRGWRAAANPNQGHRRGTGRPGESDTAGFRPSVGGCWAHFWDPHARAGSGGSRASLDSRSSQVGSCQARGCADRILPVRAPVAGYVYRRRTNSCVVSPSTRMRGPSLRRGQSTRDVTKSAVLESHCINSTGRPF